MTRRRADALPLGIHLLPLTMMSFRVTAYTRDYSGMPNKHYQNPRFRLVRISKPVFAVILSAVKDLARPILRDSSLRSE
jgi:hypothetical protein